MENPNTARHKNKHKTTTSDNGRNVSKENVVFERIVPQAVKQMWIKVSQNDKQKTNKTTNRNNANNKKDISKEFGDVILSHDVVYDNDRKRQLFYQHKNEGVSDSPELPIARSKWGIILRHVERHDPMLFKSDSNNENLPYGFPRLRRLSSGKGRSLSQSSDEVVLQPATFQTLRKSASVDILSDSTFDEPRIDIDKLNESFQDEMRTVKDIGYKFETESTVPYNKPLTSNLLYEKSKSESNLLTANGFIPNNNQANHEMTKKEKNKMRTKHRSLAELLQQDEIKLTKAVVGNDLPLVTSPTFETFQTSSSSSDITPVKQSPFLQTHNHSQTQSRSHKTIQSPTTPSNQSETLNQTPISITNNQSHNSAQPSHKPMQSFQTNKQMQSSQQSNKPMQSFQTHNSLQQSHKPMQSSQNITNQQLSVQTPMKVEPQQTQTLQKSQQLSHHQQSAQPSPTNKTPEGKVNGIEMNQRNYFGDTSSTFFQGNTIKTNNKLSENNNSTNNVPQQLTNDKGLMKLDLNNVSENANSKNQIDQLISQKKKPKIVRKVLASPSTEKPVREIKQNVHQQNVNNKTGGTSNNTAYNKLGQVVLNGNDTTPPVIRNAPVNASYNSTSNIPHSNKFTNSTDIPKIQNNNVITDNNFVKTSLRENQSETRGKAQQRSVVNENHQKPTNPNKMHVENLKVSQTKINEQDDKNIIKKSIDQKIIRVSNGITPVEIKGQNQKVESLTSTNNNLNKQIKSNSSNKEQLTLNNNKIVERENTNIQSKVIENKVNKETNENGIRKPEPVKTTQAKNRHQVNGDVLEKLEPKENKSNVNVVPRIDHSNVITEKNSYSTQNNKAVMEKSGNKTSNQTKTQPPTIQTTSSQTTDALKAKSLNRRVGKLIIMSGDERDLDLKQRALGKQGRSNKSDAKSNNENKVEGLSLTFLSNEVADLNNGDEHQNFTPPIIIFNNPPKRKQSNMAQQKGKKKKKVVTFKTKEVAIIHHYPSEASYFAEQNSPDGKNIPGLDSYQANKNDDITHFIERERDRITTDTVSSPAKETFRKPIERTMEGEHFNAFLHDDGAQAMLF